MNRSVSTTMQPSTGLQLKKMSGLSLIELMIAMTISSLLLVGVTSIYFSSRETDRFITELSRLQESGRLAIEFIARDIRMAGYQGFSDAELVDVNVIASNAPIVDAGLSAIVGFEVEDANWATADVFNGFGELVQNNGGYFRNEDFVGDALIGSDVIAISGATAASVNVSVDMADNTANVIIADNDAGFETDDIVIISAAGSADMFRITNNPGAGNNIPLIYGATGNDETFLTAAYTAGAFVTGFESVIYFVADTGRTTEKGGQINALFRARDTMVDNNNPVFEVEEMIEGIDNMQVLYGERIPLTGNLRYVTADQVNDMEAVESVQLGFLISGRTDVLPANDDSSYVLPGETIEPEGSGADVTYTADLRLRREFSMTINLRNRRTNRG